MTNKMAGNTGFRAKKKEKEADAWVNEGDQEKSEDTSENEPVKAKILLEIPASLHAEFKALCKRNGYTMRAEIRRMIEKYIRTNKNKK